MQLRFTIQNYGAWLTPGFKPSEPGDHAPFAAERRGAGRMDFYLHKEEDRLDLVASVVHYDVGEMYVSVFRTAYSREAKAEFGSGKTVTQRATWAIGLVLKDLLLANENAVSARAILVQDDVPQNRFELTRDSGYTLRFGDAVKE